MNYSSNTNRTLRTGSVCIFLYKPGYLIKIVLLTFFLLLSVFNSANSQSNPENDSAKPDKSSSSTSSTTNFDGRMLAGLNGDSMFSISMTQGLNNFAYQLNSTLSNNNDFDKKDNTSFMTNETGFTGELTLFDYWKIIPEFEIANSSYGMYENQYYSRENKDEIRLRLKNEYKPVPARWIFDLNYARYDHGLTETDTSVEEADTFHSMMGVIGMEYIWSASNKIGIRSEYGYNKYPDLYKDDSYSTNELYLSFKVTEYTMVTFTPMVCWNKDWNKNWKDYLYFKGNISTINLKYLSVELLHEYKLSAYKPEEVMYSQKYMSSLYDLPPATINHSELKTELEIETGADSSSFLGVKRVGLRLRGIYEDNNNFYNYYPLASNLLSAKAIPVNFLNGRAEFVTSIILFTQVINMAFACDYYRYFPEEPYEDIKITYRPDRIFTCSLSYEGSWLEIDWSNSYRSNVYISPDEDKTLGSSVIGNLDIYFKLHDTLYLHSRIMNLYNEEYNLRDGYPEPGIQFFTGLRIII